MQSIGDPPTLFGTDSLASIVPLSDRPGLRITGEIDISNLDRLRFALRTFARVEGDVHIELRGLSFIDSAGVHAVMNFALTRIDGARVYLHQPPRLFRRMLQLCKSVPPWLVVVDS
jgi:anti-anti-sigma factor